jgi:hypothetical protein
LVSAEFNRRRRRGVRISSFTSGTVSKPRRRIAIGDDFGCFARANSFLCRLPGSIRGWRIAELDLSFFQILLNQLAFLSSPGCLASL